MPIPETPDDPSFASIVTVLFLKVHEQLRDELDGLDDDTLNWTPTPEANSMATIVTHLVGSEAETLRCVAGVECERDRDAEFVGRTLTMGQVLGLLDDADALIDELQPHIEQERLKAVFALPTLPQEEVRPGLTWLIGNYGHAREHVGHIQMTKQLYQVRSTD